MYPHVLSQFVLITPGCKEYGVRVVSALSAVDPALDALITTSPTEELKLVPVLVTIT
jgi:hypothetical protein